MNIITFFKRYFSKAQLTSKKKNTIDQRIKYFKITK
ncbi:hypothetical protein R84B8_01375 [Treponema sp. R8-4-B8]